MTSVEDNDTVQIGPDPDKLFVYHRQQLSAMLDGELSPDEAKFMLRRLQHDTELASCWERWQVCGDVLRGRRNDLLPADFAQRVALAVGAGAAVAAEPPPARRTAGPRLARWGGGAAVAASVALMAVFATRQLPDPSLEPAVSPAPMVARADVATPDVAPAGDPAPAAVAQAEAPARPEAAMALAAVAAAEAPRRAAQRRSTRSAPRAEVAEVATAPSLVASSRPLPDLHPKDAIAPVEAFALPQATTRPWPRSLLAPQGGFTVASGSLLPREPQFEPLLPGARAWPEPAPAPATERGADPVLH